MPNPLPPPAAPGTAARARQLYLDGLGLEEIKRRTGIRSTATLYHWIDREFLPDGTVRLSPVPRRRTQRAARARRAAPERSPLLARLWRAAERQVEEIEKRLARAAAAAGDGELPAAPAEAEKEARALAVLARTLRELTALDKEERRSAKVDAEDDAVRDLDTFRRELARRLDRLREDAGGAEPAG